MGNKILSIHLIALLAAISQHGCTSRNLEECLTEASRAPTEQGVNVAASACYSKYGESKKAEKAQANAKEIIVTKTREMCYVYWDGARWQKGKTQGQDFAKFSREYYGIDLVELAIPKRMSDRFNIKEDIGNNISNKSFQEFLDRHWYQVESLCEIR